MKVIINIKNKRSQYAKFNGLTFKVAELMFGSVGVLLRQGNFNQTDFSYDEVIIVDIVEEIKKVKDSNSINDERAFKILVDYVKLKEISGSTINYFSKKI